MSAPYARTAGELPDLRAWMRDQWRPGGVFSQVAAATLAQRTPAGAQGPNAANYARWEHQALTDAELWWVGADMVDLLLAAAPEVPEDVMMGEMPRPSRAGLVIFEHPWFGTDADTPGNQVQVDAVLWDAVRLEPLPGRAWTPEDDYRPALAVSAYQRVVFENGLRGSELHHALAMGTMHHAHQQPAGPGKAVLTGCSWAPLGRSDWPVADPLGMAPYPMTPHAAASHVEDRKLLAALWTLTAQEGVADRRLAPIDRQMRRRTQRAGLHARAAQVTIYTLRRHHRPTEGDEMREGRRLTHRHYVRGFWRNQPCGQGRAERRLTFVRPHIRGPEGAPLVDKPRVQAWVR